LSDLIVGQDYRLGLNRCANFRKIARRHKIAPFKAGLRTIRLPVASAVRLMGNLDWVLGFIFDARTARVCQRRPTPRAFQLLQLTLARL
jgi:hypothetical protein